MEQLKTWTAQLVSAMREALQDLIAYLPVILLAAALIVAGWILARVLRAVTFKAVNRFDWLFRTTSGKSAGDAEALQQAAARALSAVVFWAVILSFIAAAIKSLGWTLIQGWTEDLLAYLPVLLGGVAIIVLGFIGGTLVRQIVEPAATSVGVAHSAVLARMSQAAIIVTALIIGVGQLGVDVSFLVQLITVLVGTILAGIALAFALGTREHLSNLIGIRYLRKHFQIGEQVRIGEIRGQIIDISDGCLFLETDEGDISVPGRYFTREPFTKLTDGVSHD